MFKTFDKLNIEEQVIKKSRFIALGDFVDSEKGVNEWLADVKDKYYDARHIAYAYRFSFNNQVYQKSSDDGEPSGTAGKPILNLIINDNLMNVVIAVVRYFGGIKLGAGGLTRAYAGTAKMLQKYYVDRLKEVNIICDINNADRLIKYLNNNNIKFSKNFEEKLFVKAYVVDEQKLKNDLDYVNFS